MATLAERPDGKFDPEKAARSAFENVSRTYPNQVTLEESVQTVLGLTQRAKITTFIPLLAQKILKDRARAQGNTQQTEPNIPAPNPT